MPRSGRSERAGILDAVGELTPADAEPAPACGQNPLLAAIARSDRTTRWRQAAAVPLRFHAHHPQGMTRVGEYLYISSVEVIEPTVPLPKPIDGLDRSPGRGVGHLFKVRSSGELVADIVLGEGDLYHPGGLDYDGRWLWVPVAEYRPDSRSILYRLDPDTLAHHEVLRADDHIGGVVLDRDEGWLVGVGWGARRLYRASLDGRLIGRADNESHFLDFQDCQYVGQGMALCSGISGLPTPSGEGSYELGGYALLDTRRLRVGHQVPLCLWDSAGNALTRNATHFEGTADGGLRLYATPADGTESVLYIYEAAP